MSNIKSFKTLSVETSQRAYALETSIDLGLLEEYIYEAAMNADVGLDGDWDEDMMRVAFDLLERLLDRIRRM